MKAKRFWINEGGKYRTHWNGFFEKQDPDSIIFKSDDCWNFMQEYADHENKKLKEMNSKQLRFWLIMFLALGTIILIALFVEIIINYPIK